MIPSVVGLALLYYNTRNSDEKDKKELLRFIFLAMLIGCAASKLSVGLTQILRALFEPSSANHIFKYFWQTISRQSSFVAMFVAMYLLLTKKYKNIAYKYGNVFVPSLSLFLIFVFSFAYFNIMQHMGSMTSGQPSYNFFIISKYFIILHIIFGLTALILSQRK